MSASQTHRPTWTLSSVLLGSGTLLALAAMSCSDPEVPETPVPDAGPTTTTTPEPVDAGPTVQTGPCDAVMSAGIAQRIKEQEEAALTHGMKPEGSITCAHVAEGGAAAAKFVLQQGRCYTFIGTSYPNVTELALEMKLDMGDNPPPMFAKLAATLQADPDMGQNAVIGRKDGCYKWEFMIPAAVRVEAIAKAGAGPVAVQAYSK